MCVGYRNLRQPDRVQTPSIENGIIQENWHYCD